MLVRVQKVLAQSGVASRRKCEELIVAGKVLVNNKKIKLGDKVDPDKDIISVNNKPVSVEKKVYIILNKPKRYLSAVSDVFERKTIMDLVDVKEKIFPVGRLDRDAHGLMLLTNDGDVANRIMHPRYNVEKTYVVGVREKLNPDDVARLRRGVKIERYKVVPSNVLMLNNHQIKIVIHEGKKHIVKRLLFKLGYFVTDLIRTQIANICLNDLKEGSWRELSVEELRNLRNSLNVL